MNSQEVVNVVKPVVRDAAVADILSASGCASRRKAK